MTPIVLSALSFLPWIGPDPAPSVFRSRTRSRRYDCERISEEQGRREYPGVVDPPDSRSDFGQTGTVVCRERLLPDDLRHPRDHAVLAHLEAVATELATAATAMRPDLAGRTWLVEPYYPNALVAPKLSFAVKNALVIGGFSVSDRTPVLGAGDVDVLTRMAPTQAYPAACRRYAATGSVGPDDVLLGVMVRDLRETALHAGLCADGVWTWVQ